MKLIKAVLFPIIVFLQLASCKDTGTGPNQKPFKDPREMTWTADTLRPVGGATQILPVSMLAFAPNDVWLACWSDVARGLLWHYNGKVWTESNIFADVGGMRVFVITGNSSNDLWVGGYSGKNIFLGHYNGMSWTRSDDMGIAGEILDMSKDASGNIWACGSNGIVLQYTQGKWVADTIKIAGFNQNDCYLYSMNYYDGKIYLLARNDANTQFAYISGDINHWTVMDMFPKTSSTDVIKWGTLGSFNVSNGKLYSYGLRGVWQLGSTGWNKMLDSDRAIRNISGPSEDYIIGVGAFKTVLFYNGGSWQSISDVIKENDSDFASNEVWTDGYEIIMAGYSTINGIQKTIIWHGK